MKRLLCFLLFACCTVMVSAQSVVAEKPTFSKQLLKRAKGGDAVAQLQIGICYEYGYGIEQDYCKAEEWYKKAAEQHVADAEYALSQIYRFGLCSSVDKAKYLEWLKRAADDGSPEAQFELGKLYYLGDGVPKDRDKANQLIGKAAEQGHAEAKMMDEGNNPQKYAAERERKRAEAQKEQEKENEKPITDSEQTAPEEAKVEAPEEAEVKEKEAEDENPDEESETSSSSGFGGGFSMRTTTSTRSTPAKPYIIDYSWGFPLLDFTHARASIKLWDPYYPPQWGPSRLVTDFVQGEVINLYRKYVLGMWIAHEYTDYETGSKFTDQWRKELAEAFRHVNKETDIPTYVDSSLPFKLKRPFRFFKYRDFTTVEPAVWETFVATFDKRYIQYMHLSDYGAIIVNELDRVCCCNLSYNNTVLFPAGTAGLNIDYESITYRNMEMFERINAILIVSKQSELWQRALAIEKELKDQFEESLDKVKARIIQHQKTINVTRSRADGTRPLTGY